MKSQTHSLSHTSPKILVIHNTYKNKGGEDSVYSNEVSLLNAHGNLAGTYVFDNDNISGLFGKIRTAICSVFSLRSFLITRNLIRRYRPDVVHVHNFFPLASPSVFYACRAERIPVVHTLHNYRILCPTALLMHNGEVTERSLSDGPWWALRYKVYRGSWAGTLVLCMMISLHQHFGTWRRTVDRFIVLSEFGRRRFTAGGLPPNRLVVKPNFVDLPALESTTRNSLLFVGRLSSEKGVEVLLKAAEGIHHKLKEEACEIRIVGSGPLTELVRTSTNVVKPVGVLSSEGVHDEMSRACALLLPSVWYEGFPMVLVEAYANGLPVIASRIGALAELVEDGVTGLLFEPGNSDDMAKKMVWASENPLEMARMGVNARQRYEDRYTSHQNYKQLMAIYNSVINERRCFDHEA